MREMLRYLRHRLAHRFGANLGRIDCWYQDGILMAGFRCDGCHEWSGVHAVDHKPIPWGKFPESGGNSDPFIFERTNGGAARRSGFR